MRFIDALKLHLNFIQNRDLASFSSTISEDSITLIMMNGVIIDNRVNLLNFIESGLMIGIGI